MAKKLIHLPSHDWMSIVDDGPELSWDEKEGRIVDKVKKLFETYENSFREYADQHAVDARERMAEIVEKQKISVIEILAIFVALFTFVSIEFQILSILSDWKSIVGFSLILLGSLAFMIGLIDRILYRNVTIKWVKKEKNIFRYCVNLAYSFLLSRVFQVIIFPILAITSGIWAVSMVKNQMPQMNSSERESSVQQFSIYNDRENTNETATTSTHFIQEVIE